MKHFTPQELQDYLSGLDPAEHPLLLDVREPWEYQICQIPGSQLIPMRQIPDQANVLNPEQEIVVICHRGNRSRQVGYFLEQYGFDRLINLAGGVQAWARDVDPQMPTY